MKYIHINCDLGEGGEQDEQLMPLISACNIACGGHAGDAGTMERTAKLALENQVEIGAHPSYPDKENFGRKTLLMSSEELKRSLKKQILDLKEIVKKQGGKLQHIKPHGALYNDAAKDEKMAAVVLEAVLECDENVSVYVPPFSVIEELAKGKIKVLKEAFADRNYEDDFQLVLRQKSNAVITENEKVFEHLFSMFSEEKITTINLKNLALKADTFCLHSDTKNSVEILKYLNRKFREKNIGICKK